MHLPPDTVCIDLKAVNLLNGVDKGDVCYEKAASWVWHAAGFQLNPRQVMAYLHTPAKV